MSAPAPQRLNSLQFSLVAACVLAAVLPHLWRLPFAFAAASLLVAAVRWITRLRGSGRNWLPRELSEISCERVQPALEIRRCGRGESGELQCDLR